MNIKIVHLIKHYQEFQARLSAQIHARPRAIPVRDMTPVSDYTFFLLCFIAFFARCNNNNGFLLPSILINAANVPVKTLILFFCTLKKISTFYQMFSRHDERGMWCVCLRNRHAWCVFFSSFSLHFSIMFKHFRYLRFFALPLFNFFYLMCETRNICALVYSVAANFYTCSQLKKYYYSIVIICENWFLSFSSAIAIALSLEVYRRRCRRRYRHRHTFFLSLPRTKEWEFCIQLVTSVWHTPAPFFRPSFFSFFNTSRSRMFASHSFPVYFDCENWRKPSLFFTLSLSLVQRVFLYRPDWCFTFLLKHFVEWIFIANFIASKWKYRNQYMEICEKRKWKKGCICGKKNLYFFVLGRQKKLLFT